MLPSLKDSESLKHSLFASFNTKLCSEHFVVCINIPISLILCSGLKRVKGCLEANNSDMQIIRPSHLYKYKGMLEYYLWYMITFVIQGNAPYILSPGHAFTYCFVLHKYFMSLSFFSRRLFYLWNIMIIIKPIYFPRLGSLGTAVPWGVDHSHIISYVVSTYKVSISLSRDDLTHYFDHIWSSFWHWLANVFIKY